MRSSWLLALLILAVSVVGLSMGATLPLVAMHKIEDMVLAQDYVRTARAKGLDETQVLIRPLSGDARDFLAFWTARFELSNVKTLLRSKMSGERPAAVLARLTPMGAFGRLDKLRPGDKIVLETPVGTRTRCPGSISRRWKPSGCRIWMALTCCCWARRRRRCRWRG